MQNQRRAEGLGREEALIAAGEIRLRPILMTTLAMIFGMLPLALALGEGAEFRSPMARAVIGGLISSTVLTLVVGAGRLHLSRQLGDAVFAQVWQQVMLPMGHPPRTRTIRLPRRTPP